jgi:HPt (histidine-containing phosphotransfer) domain-containing protein
METEFTSHVVFSTVLDQLWIKFLPLLEERIESIESIVSQPEAIDLSSPQRTQSKTAAHKLAGALGTFGLIRGTELAREAEVLLSGEGALTPQSAIRLQTLTAQLRSIVEGRNGAPVAS